MKLAFIGNGFADELLGQAEWRVRNYSDSVHYDWLGQIITDNRESRPKVSNVRTVAKMTSLF